MLRRIYLRVLDVIPAQLLIKIMADQVTSIETEFKALLFCLRSSKDRDRLKCGQHEVKRRVTVDRAVRTGVRPQRMNQSHQLYAPYRGAGRSV